MFRRADFPKAKFQEEADFDGAKFQEEADFDGAKFQEEAYFQEAEFHRGVRFMETKFQAEANFYGAKFQRRADFGGAKFQAEANFYGANFQGIADFNHSEFYGITYFSGQFDSETEFHYVLFEGKEKVIFDIENLSNVSFMNTDITGVRFSDKAIWGGDTKEDRFKVVDERLLEEEINKENDGHTTKDFNLGSIKAVYRSLRENYEYRMRYDEAGQFFMRNGIEKNV